TALTVIMFVTVSQVIRAVPVPCDSGCAGFSLSGLSPGATGPVATNVRVAAGLLTATMTKRANTHPICFIKILLCGGVYHIGKSQPVGCLVNVRSALLSVANC